MIEADVDAPARRYWSQKHYTAFDGSRLHYRHWPSGAAGGSRGAIVLMHRGHEHSGRIAHLADELCLPDFDVFAPDARGHGLSREANHDADHVGVLTRDLDMFVKHLGKQHGIGCDRIMLVAQSIGGVAAAAWVHDYAPGIRGLVLAAPAFEVKMILPFARLAMQLRQDVFGRFKVSSFAQPWMLTRDRERQRSYYLDELITRPISSDLLLDLFETSKRVVADAGAIRVPTQVLTAGRDWVVRDGPQERFAANLGSGVKEHQVFPALLHDLFGERDRAPVVASVRRFLLACFAREAKAPELGVEDQAGRTCAEAEMLGRALPAGSVKGLYWRGLKTATRLGGRVSKGLALGVETGFDSGATLDYVYRDEPAGIGPIGRYVDRQYLDAVGWRGIRQRKLHVEELIQEAMARLAEAGKPVRIADIAAGHGRYVFDAVLESPVDYETLRLRDYCERNVVAGREMIGALKLGDRAAFDQGDAFDREALATIAPAPTLAIVSGLYELFPENAPVEASLAGLADAVPEGGYLLYTCQPWHPQLEQIARTLNSHRGGQDWVMRLRTQAEMDGLVTRAGFRKLEQRIDRWGIFTVSLAERLGAPDARVIDWEAGQSTKPPPKT